MSERITPDPIHVEINHDTGEAKASQKELEYWTKVARVVGDEVRVTTCCCAAPGATRRECMTAAGNKTPCRCFCHHTKPLKPPAGKAGPSLP
jgi:hypothetical protein